MIREKAYAYLRVSTLQQVDGNSLEGQEAEIRRYCEYQNIDWQARVSEDAEGCGRKAGSSIYRCMEDVTIWKECLRQLKCVETAPEKQCEFDYGGGSYRYL